MEQLGNNFEQTVSRGFLGLYQEIAGGEKALVASILGGKEREVSGPQVVGPLSNLRLYDKRELLPGEKIQVYNPGSTEPQTIDSPGVHFIHPDAIVINYKKVIINEREKAWIYDENGSYTEVTGPEVVYEHPEGKVVKFRRLQLSERQAVVKVDSEGKEEILLGSEHPEVYVNPITEQIKNFRWTGSGESGPESEKVPGMLNFEVLRLDDSQTYFSFSVRTKDNVVIELKLMIFYKISDVENLIKNTHDPMSEFYNKIQAFITTQVAGEKFDSFKDGTGVFISGLAESDELDFGDIGLEIENIVVREWTPEERRVQDVLEKAAMVEGQKSLDEADHERALKLLEYQKEEAEKQSEIAEVQKTNSQQEGEREGVKLASMYEAMKEQIGEDGALEIMRLHIASNAAELHIGDTNG